MKKICSICLFILLVLGTIGCSDTKEKKVEPVMVKPKVEKVEVKRVHSFNESPVAFHEALDIEIFKKAVKTAKKEPGIANMSYPMYEIRMDEESYFLWLINERGTLMNTRDTHTIYSLQEESIMELKELFTKTYPAIKPDGTFDMSFYTDFPMSPNDVGSYIGAMNPTPIEDVENGVYVRGVHAHGDRQSFQIFSKVSLGDYQSSKAYLEGENLIIEVTSHEAKNGEESYPYVLHGLSMSENPRNVVIIRNGKIEKKEEIPYGIE